jgi:hypothetical protein
MEHEQYAARLEKKLIEEFKTVFQQKLGYSPTVFTRTERTASEIPYMTLEELGKLFTKFLPSKYGEVVPLQTTWRMREIVELRSIFCFLAKNMKYSLKNIGRYLGRDHTTVMHGLKIFRDLFDTDEIFRQKYLTIQKYIIQETKSVDYESFLMDDMLEVQPSTEPALLP